MRSLFFVMFCFCALTAFSQKDSSAPIESQPKLPTDSLDLHFSEVDVEATIDPQLWRSHLEKAMLPILKKAVRKGLPPGVYVVNVKFIIERDGSISEAGVTSDPGYGLAKGAAEIVLFGPKWTPAIQNNQKVRSYRLQPITFIVRK